MKNVTYIVKVKCTQIINGQHIEYNEVIGECTSLDSAQIMQKSCADAFIETRRIQNDPE